MRDTSGPAFPAPVGGSSFTGPDGYTTWQYPGSSGMTLRQYYAAQALPGWIQALATRSCQSGYEDSAAAAEAARMSLISADAIIALQEANT